MRRNIFLLMIGLITFGCQTNEIADNSNEVKIDAIYPSSSVSRIAGNSFVDNDEIGLYMVKHTDGEIPLLQYAGNYATNVKVTYNSSSWTCVPKIYWEDGVYDFYAYYPYMDNPNSVDELNFQVQLDQSSDGYSKSDFLWTKSNSVAVTENAVPLIFSHKLSRLLVVFEKGQDYTGDLPKNAEVYIHNTNPNAIIDLRSGDVVCNSKLATSTIRAKHISEANYEAIIVPQRISNRVPFIEVIVNNVSYLVESKFMFKAGMSHTYKVILSDDPENVEIEIGGSIDGWS